MSQKILNKRSSVFGKAPLPSQIEVGEIAINFNHENPFLSILDSNGEIQKFLSETKTRGLIQDAKEDIDNSFYTKEEINNMFEAFDPSGEVDLDNYYTKRETDNLLAGKANSAHTHSYNSLTDKPVIPSIDGLASEVWVGENYQPKGNYLTEHQSLENYYTKSEADNKFLTSHQDLSDYALKSEIPDVSNFVTSAFTDATYAKKGEAPTDVYTKSESDSKFQPQSGMTDYALKSELPSTTGLASEEWVSNNFSSTAHTHSDLATKAELENYLTIVSASTTYATKSEIPDISDLATKNEIPDTSSFVTSAFTEEHYAKKGEVPSDAYTKAETDTLLAGKANSAHTHDYETLTNKPDLSNFATKGEIPDTSNFITSAFTEDHYQPKGTYVVPSDLNDYALKSELPSIEGLATEAELANYMSLSGMSGYSEVNHTHDYSQIQNTPDLSGYASLSDVPKIWKGTLAEYTNLTEIDNDTLYVITDESEQFVTSGEVESMISGFTNLTEVQTLLEGYSTTAHTHDYSEIQNTPDLSGFASLSDIPDTSNFITSGFCEDRYQPKGTYVVPSDLDDYALKSEIPSIEGLATEAELANYQPVSSMTGYSTTAHTHSYNDLTDKPTIPSTSGLASETWVSNNFATTGHTHSQYLTETSADTRYARVVSCTQAQYDALVQNDQVEQGVLYCIIEQSNS